MARVYVARDSASNAPCPFPARSRRNRFADLQTGLIREHAAFFVANRTTPLSAMPFHAP
jgi:hypothetical protein